MSLRRVHVKNSVYDIVLNTSGYSLVPRLITAFFLQVLKSWDKTGDKPTSSSSWVRG